MFHFMGIQFGNCDYKLQQIIPDTDGKPVQKTSDILFWVVADVGNGILYIPVSKLDMELNKTVVPSQILACYNDRTRTLLKKTPRGTATIPFGGILQRWLWRNSPYNSRRIFPNSPYIYILSRLS